MSINRRLDVPMKTGDEHEGLSRSSRWLNWRPGVRKALKTRFARRVRRAPVEVDAEDGG